MFFIFLFLLGISIGSFLNVLIDRLPFNQTVQGRSRCDYCQHKLGVVDLIPVASWFLLGGRCRYCGKRISFFYPLVEFLTGILFIATWLYSPDDNYLIKYAYLGIISTSIVIFFADLKYHLIPDQVQIALFVFSLVLLPIHGFIPQIFVNRVVAAILVMTPIYFLHLITRGKGMGFGDVKLAFVIGFLLGVKGGLLGLYFAFITGAIVGLILLVLGKKGLKSRIAFGPFLVLGMLIMLFWQGEIWVLIQKIYGL